MRPPTAPAGAERSKDKELQVQHIDQLSSQLLAVMGRISNSYQQATLEVQKEACYVLLLLLSSLYF